MERELSGLLDRIVAADFPFLGACYGVGTLGLHQGAVIDRTYGEQLGGVTISLSPEGLEDPLLAGMPAEFTAFTGHKEACTVLPRNAVLLASSAACPVHMFRIKKNLYATQFHPELDAEGLVTRIDIYRHAGYFPPESAEELMAAARTFTATESCALMASAILRCEASDCSGRPGWPSDSRRVSRIIPAMKDMSWASTAECAAAVTA